MSNPARRQSNVKSPAWITGLAVTLFTLACLQTWASSTTWAQLQPNGSSSAYRVNAGDRISVTVFGQPEISGDFLIDQNGTLRLPLLGDISASNRTPSELENLIARALERDYLRNPVVSVRISEFSPIHVVGLVRTPGLYPYRQGVSVLGAIAQAGGFGAPESRQGAVVADAIQAEERVRLLELSRVALTMRRARLIALRDNSAELKFPDSSGFLMDAARLDQIIEGERQEFNAEREALRQDLSVFQQQIARLQSEIEMLNNQKALEEKQTRLNQELLTDYEKLVKSGLIRKPSYIEAKREEVRIATRLAQLDTERLRVQRMIGDMEIRIGELRNNYRRRVAGELQETERALRELAVTLPSAQQARAYRAQQIGMLSVEEAQQPTITVIRPKDGAFVRLPATLEFALRPGDIVQVGSLLPPPIPVPVAADPASRSRGALSDPHSRAADANLPHRREASPVSRVEALAATRRENDAQ